MGVFRSVCQWFYQRGFFSKAEEAPDNNSNVENVPEGHRRYPELRDLEHEEHLTEEINESSLSLGSAHIQERIERIKHGSRYSDLDKPSWPPGDDFL